MSRGPEDAIGVKATLGYWIGDPRARAQAVLVAVAIAGFAIIAAAWSASTQQAYVVLQVPWVVSGGLGGLALSGLALGAWAIHVSRRCDAFEDQLMDQLVEELAQLAAVPFAESARGR